MTDDAPGDPFDDPEVRALMARHGIVRKPGMAADALAEMAPLLADEGIDLDDLKAADLPRVNAALARATERRNLELFTPVGAQRDQSLILLARLAAAVDADDPEQASLLLSAIAPEPGPKTPAISHVIGVSVGLLDEWAADPDLAGAMRSVKPPRWAERAKRATTDILALGSKGRAFAALEALHRSHSGLSIFEGGALAVAAIVALHATRQGRGVAQTAKDLLGVDPAASGSAPPATGAAFGIGRRLLPAVPESSSGSSDLEEERILLRDFRAWLRNSGAEAADAADAAGLLRDLMKMARRGGADLREPDGVLDMAAFLIEAADEEDPNYAARLGGTLDVLEDWMNFHAEAVGGAAWAEAQIELEELIDDVFSDGEPPFRDLLVDALDAAGRIDEAERRAVIAQVAVVEAVGRLLSWLEHGRPVTSAGLLRRADIAPVAAFLGIDAVGVARYPDEDEADADPYRRGPLRVRSMTEIPQLALWWESLLAAELIEITPTRVRPGSHAGEWMTDPAPPLLLAEQFLAMNIVQTIIGYDLEDSWVRAGVAQTMRRLLVSIDPDSDRAAALDAEGDAPHSPGVAPWGEVVTFDLRRLQVVAGDAGHFVVPPELRGAMARALMITLTLLPITPG